MMSIPTNLKAEIRDFRCDYFWQPMLEAITNSFQANATNIKLTFISNDIQGSLLEKKIDSFHIEDNGDGFNEINRNNFIQLKNSKFSKDPNKKGCKGMGRLSYLKVFNNVNLISFTGSEKVSFNFNEEFNYNSLTSTQDQTPKSTKIIFNDITELFLKYEGGNLKKDRREILDLEKTKQITLNHLLHLLFFKKKSGIDFKITFSAQDLEDVVIDSDSIPNFQDDKSFLLKDSQENEYLFTLLYSITNIEQEKGIIHDYYCANERAVCRFKDKGVAICPIDKTNITLLLTSDFFDKDDVVKTDRQDFRIKNKDTSAFIPFNWNDDINPKLKEKIVEVLAKAIPEYESRKKKQKDSIINKRPYLAKYILNNDMLGILDEKEEIRSAQKTFNDEKNLCLGLIDSGNSLNIEQKEKLKDALSIELSEYMWLRYNRLKDIKKLLKNKESNEKLIHNLFLPQGSVLDDETLLIEDIHKNNLWLIDDRFMSYRYAFSDKKIKKIKESLGDKNSSTTDSQEPDFLVVFDSIDDDSDSRGVAVELKPFGLDYDANKKGITQLIDYKIAFFDSEKIKESWYYLITNIDDKFENYLKKGLGYKELISGSGKIFFDSDMRIFVTPIETLINECEKKHEVFFEILKKISIK